MSTETASATDVSIDREKNVLYLTLSGKPDLPEMEALAEETLQKARRLSDGFVIVNDISRLKPIGPDVAGPIKRAQQELKAMGVGDVVRVADEDTSDVVVNAFVRRSRSAGYEGDLASTVAEAERRAGLR
jgi:hypothetical protein